MLQFATECTQHTGRSIGFPKPVNFSASAQVGLFRFLIGKNVEIENGLRQCVMRQLDMPILV